MEVIVNYTKWMMEPVKPYGLFHIVMFTVGMIGIIVLTNYLRKLTTKQSDYFIFALGVILLITEIYKQFFYYYIVEPNSYSWWIFPFQMCSIPMYGAILLIFIKNEKVKSTLLDYMFSFGLFGGLVAFIEPSGLIHEYWALTIHAFVWHLMLILIGIHIYRNRSFEFKTFKYPLILFIILLVIALLINFAVIGLTGEYINMFFAGPETTTIIVFSQISEIAGWIVSDLVFFPIIITAVYFLRKFLLKLKRKNSTII